MRLSIDFETRSRVDLRECGAYRYAEDPSTDVLCLAVSVDGWAPEVWVPDKFRHLYAGPVMGQGRLSRMVEKADEIRAHNAGFERVIWQNIMVDRYGFPVVPLETWRCTAAKAAAMNIPRNLDAACEVMGLPGKDKEGAAVMLKMCKPLGKNRIGAGGWAEDPQDFEALVRYCQKDVEIEEALWEILPDLSPAELDMWRMNERLNDRGVAVDLEAVAAMRGLVDSYCAGLDAEMAELTGGAVSGPSKIVDLRKWLAARGADLPNVQLSTLKRLVNRIDDAASRRAVELRIIFSKATSCAKYGAIERSVCRDGRLRGMFLYCGAQATGRWSARLVQLQNLPRGAMSAEAVERCLWGAVNIGECGGDPLAVGSACIRGVLVGGGPC